MIAVEKAYELGISAPCLRSWVRQGRLSHPAPEVYVVAGAPNSWSQQVAVAALSTNGWASHRTAAALWRLAGFEPRQIEVLAPHGRWRTRRDWTVHETRRFSGVDIDEVDGIRCTSVVRTLLDLPAIAHPFVVGMALDHACRSWPGILDAVVARFLELASRGRRGTRLMRAMLDERRGSGAFTQSGFETMAVRLVEAIGLPRPVLQHHVRDENFSAYLDLAWPSVLWAVECDSLAWHSGKRSHEWDRARRRKLKLLGWDIVEVTYDDVSKRRQQTGRQLRELYEARRASFARAD